MLIFHRKRTKYWQNIQTFSFRCCLDSSKFAPNFYLPGQKINFGLQHYPFQSFCKDLDHKFFNRENLSCENISKFVLRVKAQKAGKHETDYNYRSQTGTPETASFTFRLEDSHIKFLSHRVSSVDIKTFLNPS